MLNKHIINTWNIDSTEANRYLHSSAYDVIIVAINANIQMTTELDIQLNKIVIEKMSFSSSANLNDYKGKISEI